MSLNGDANRRWWADFGRRPDRSSGRSVAPAARKQRSSLACPQYHHHHRDQAHSRLTSAITAPQTPRWRPPATGDYASQPLTGTRRAALLGTCARARATRRHAPSGETDESLVPRTTVRTPAAEKSLIPSATGFYIGYRDKRLRS